MRLRKQLTKYISAAMLIFTLVIVFTTSASAANGEVSSAGSGGNAGGVTAIELSQSSLELQQGDQVKLDYTLKPSAAANKEVTWSISNPEVVSVVYGTDYITLTGVNVGTTTVTVSTKHGHRMATCTVEVLGPNKQWGVVAGGRYAIGGGDYVVNILEQDAVKSYQLDDSVEDQFPAANNQVVAYTLNGDNEIDSIYAYPGYPEVTVTKVEKANGKLIVSYRVDQFSTAQYVAFDDQVKFFDYSTGTMEVADSISRDDVVVAYDLLDEQGNVVAEGAGDGIADVFVIVN